MLLFCSECFLEFLSLSLFVPVLYEYFDILARAGPPMRLGEAPASGGRSAKSNHLLIDLNKAIIILRLETENLPAEGDKESKHQRGEGEKKMS